jgi:long-subunit fatty acid transport protein
MSITEQETSQKRVFTVAANYDNRFYFGAGLNFHNSYLSQDDFANFQNNTTNTISSFDKQYTNFTERADGFSANIGVIAKLNNQFRLGASIETPGGIWIEFLINIIRKTVIMMFLLKTENCQHL